MKRAGLHSGFERFVAKYKEWILAYRMEQEFTKEEILELYLEYELLRPALVWRRDGGADLFRQDARRAHRFGDRDPRRHSAAADRSGTRVRARSERRTRRSLRAAAHAGDGRDQRRAVPGGARRARRRQGVRSRRGSSRRRTSPRWCGPRWSGASATRATTAGLKVTTTIDSRLQAAANRAMRDTLMAYDERHGYRGPLARVRASRRRSGRRRSRRRRPSSTRARCAALLDDDHPPRARLRERDRARARTTSLRACSSRLRRATDRLRCRRVGRAVHQRRRRPARGRRRSLTCCSPATSCVSAARPKAVGGSRRYPKCRARSCRSIRSTARSSRSTGGFDFFLNNFNRATQAERQPGSSFKPFVYSAAFENGFTPATVVLDAPPDVGYQADARARLAPGEFRRQVLRPVAVA